MNKSTQELATEFAQEVRSRKRDRSLNHTRFIAFGFIVLMVGASFIEVPSLRRWIGLGLVSLVLGIKGYASVQQWKNKAGSDRDSVR